MTLMRPTDIIDAIVTKLEWQSVYGNPHAYRYLGFSPTGAIHLSGVARELDDGRDEPAKVCLICMNPVRQMCVAVRGAAIPFFAIVPPLAKTDFSYREVRVLYYDRVKKLRATLAQCGGRLFETFQYAAFDDSCFVDNVHLNAKGSEYLTQLFLDWRRGTVMPDRRDFNCR